MRANVTRRECPILWRAVDIPDEYCATEVVNGAPVSFGGDIRIGDLRGTGQIDFLVYRSCDDAHDGGGMKPCFLGAFTLDGEPIWRVGNGGNVYARFKPGPRQYNPRLMD